MDLIKKLEYCLKNTPPEQIKSMWDSTESLDQEGVKVSDFITNTNINKIVMRSKIIEDILKKTPIKTRIKVDIQSAFINLITELGYRESKYWTEDEEPILQKLTELANQTTDYIMESIDDWERDGKPL